MIGALTHLVRYGALLIVTHIGVLILFPALEDDAHIAILLLVPFALLVLIYRLGRPGPVAAPVPPETLEDRERRFLSTPPTLWPDRRSAPAPAAGGRAPGAAQASRPPPPAPPVRAAPPPLTGAPASAAAPPPLSGTALSPAPLPVAGQPLERQRMARTEPPLLPTAARANPVPPPQGGWVPAGGALRIQGRDIGGMVYLGPPPRNHPAALSDHGWIAPSLPVASDGGDPAGDGLPYWPTYAEIPPRSRATYLDWLAGGRDAADTNVGYVFLYFYGLEKRFFLEKAPEAERRTIIAEVARLRAVYGHNGSVRRYLGDFIQTATAVVDGLPVVPPEPDGGWDLPLSLKLALGRRIADGEPLTSAWLLSWFLHHPERNLRTAAQRCAPEFRAMFGLIFDQRFAGGLTVRKPRKLLRPVYRAASGSFDADLTPLFGAACPDVADQRRPIEIAQEIADEASAALDRFSRFIGRNPDGRGTIEGQALLPPALAALFPSAALDALRDWTAEVIASGGQVGTDALLARLLGAAAPARVLRRHLADAQDALARFGVGLAPDPRHALRLPAGDEPMVLFPQPDGPAPAEASEAFLRALLQITLGSLVAQADGTSSGAERASLARLVEAEPGLTAAERRRLAAELDWLFAVPPDLRPLRSRLKAIPATQQAPLRQAMITVAQADGFAGAEEVAGIERVYRLLGIDPREAYSDLHAGAVDAAPQRPADAVPEETRRLDPGRIAAIRADTALVSSVLGNIFDPGPDEAAEPPAAAPPPVPAALAGLDPRHAALATAALAAPDLDAAGFAALAASHGLMPDGAIETLNEWAFDTYDDALIDEYDGFAVSAGIAGTLRAALATKEAP